MSWLAETIRLANAQFEGELRQTEECLIDIGCNGEEIEYWIGRNGVWRRRLEASRDQQIAEIKNWLDSLRGDGPRTEGVVGFQSAPGLGDPIN